MVPAKIFVHELHEPSTRKAKGKTVAEVEERAKEPQVLPTATGWTSPYLEFLMNQKLP
uniref:Uncharacterized protein n=1 Tax=Arundo donax TaxID=35708 RepID=A0A0A9CEP2_ARUDO